MSHNAETLQTPVGHITVNPPGKARNVTVWTRYWPKWPIVVWLILITILIGIFSGKSADEIISLFNRGWGYAIGEFALILIPSFVLAAALSRQQISVPEVLSVGLSPAMGAGMICPDTAYAALSPMNKQRKLSLAFSAYAGFKLLFPAGPLIIATSLGVTDGKLLALCILIFLPVWAASLLYARAIEARISTEETSIPVESHTESTVRLNTGKGRSKVLSLVQLWPLALLAVLLAAGIFFDFSFNSWIDFATNPKGALLIAAAIALSTVSQRERSACIESGIRQAASLLLIIGAASAFSAFLTDIIPVTMLMGISKGNFILLTLFSLAAMFKLLQGSSMATFAAVGPVAAPIVANSGVSPTLAVIAICLGSFVAILPNDSFYWLVRNNALTHRSQIKAIVILGVGSVLQAIVGFAALLGISMMSLA